MRRIYQRLALRDSFGLQTRRVGEFYLDDEIAITHGLAVNINRTRLVGLALAIFAGALWLHWPSVRGGFLTGMDDDEYVRQAIRLKSSAWGAVQWAFTSTEPYYHPLPRLSHVLDYRMWGTNAAGHHATSVILHALNAALLFGFLWTLLAGAGLTTGERLAMAFSIAVVFAIHPMQVESVSWLSCRTQLMGMAFGIGSLWVYAAGGRRWAWWTLYIAALLCKPTAISLPFAMLAMDYFLLGRHERHDWGPLVREKAVPIALGVAMMLVTLVTESRAGGMMVATETIPAAQRISLMIQSLTFYPWKMVWPAWLSPLYPRRLDISLFQPTILASALCVGIVTVGSLWCRRKAPALVVGWGIYVLFILPVSGLMPVGDHAVADRYAYTLLVPLLLLAGGAVVWSWRRCASITRVTLAVLLVCEVCFFGLITRGQIPVWHNDETLWRAVLAQFPDSYLANRALALTLLRQNQIPEAIPYAQLAVRIAPQWSEAHNSLGLVLARAGRLDEAVGQYEQSLQIKPDDAAVCNNLGNALSREGKISEAIAQYERSLQFKPDAADVHCNFGLALEKMGRVREAIGQYEQSLQIDPEYSNAASNLAWLLATHADVGDPDRAMTLAERACKLTNNRVAADLDTLAAAYAAAGRFKEAIATTQTAIELARASGQPELARKVEARLKLYRNGRPYREAMTVTPAQNP